MWIPFTCSVSRWGFKHTVGIRVVTKDIMWILFTCSVPLWGFKHNAEMHVVATCSFNKRRLGWQERIDYHLDEQSGSECSCQNDMVSFEMTSHGRADRYQTPMYRSRWPYRFPVCGLTRMSLGNVVSWCQVNRADLNAHLVWRSTPPPTSRNRLQSIPRAASPRTTRGINHWNHSEWRTIQSPVQNDILPKSSILMVLLLDA